MTSPTITPAEFETLRKFMYNTTGIALADGKRQMVQSRLQKRLRAHGLENYGAYLRFAMEDPQEQVELVNSLTTNKTDFFREPHHFEFLTREFLPRMAQEAALGQRPKRLRVWHAGCSTGEEPYTMAMTVAESPLADPSWDVRLLASDIDTNVIAHAEAGIYDADRLEPIPMERRRRHFLRGTGQYAERYRVRPELRELLTFRQINLLADAWPMRPETRFDVIFCRNVVIYFDRPTQARLFERFLARIRPGGLLIIGHSESLGALSDSVVSRGHTIFQVPEATARAA